MQYFQLPADTLRLGDVTGFALRDKSGKLLVPRGISLTTQAQLDTLLSRELYVDAHDAEQLRRTMGAQLDEMVRNNVRIGRIAAARIDISMEEGSPEADKPRRVDDPAGAWTRQQERLAPLLRDPVAGEFGTDIRREDRQMLYLLDGAPDVALLLLVHKAAHDVVDYSVEHAMLVAVVCELAARPLRLWTTAERVSLRCAALSMNVATTRLQNQLARQDTPLTDEQRAELAGHGRRGAQMLRAVGVDDELWLSAVEQHHDMPPGPLSQLPMAGQMARLIQRADVFGARLSARKRRLALSGTMAAKAAFLDETGQPDEAGAAIVKAVGINPPGSLVRLASQEIAVVLGRGPRANEPVVAAITNPAGEPLGEPSPRDTRLATHAVTGSVAPHEARLRLNLAKLVRMA